MITLLRKHFGGEGLKARSFRASFLTLVQIGGYKVMQLASNLILTRILFPEAFGLMALVTVFIGGLMMISDVGIRPSIVRSERAGEPVFQATAWTLQIVRGGILTLAALALAWPYAQVYEQPELVPLVAVMAFSTLFLGFESIEVSIRQRNLHMARLVMVQLAEKFLTVLITIALALWLESVWALVYGGLSGSILRLVLGLWFFPSPNHRLAWDRSVLGEIMTFGRWILLGTLFTYLGGRGNAAIQGIMVDLETLAFFTIAIQFGWMIGEIVVTVIGRVGFSALSQIHRENPNAIGKTVRNIRLLQFAPTIPAFLLLSAFAQPFIYFLYDPRYSEAGVYLAFVALNGALATLTVVYRQALLAQADSRTVSFLSGIEVASKILFSVIGFTLFGPVGLIVGIGAGSLVSNALGSIVAARRGFADLKLDIGLTVVILAFYAIQLS